MIWLRSSRSLKPRWSGDGNQMCMIAGTWLRWPQSHSAMGKIDRKGGARNLGPISPAAEMSIYIWIFVFLNVLMCVWGPLFGSSLEWKVPELVWWWCQAGATPEPLNWLKYAATGTGRWESGSTWRKCKNVAKIKLSTPRVTFQSLMSLQGFTREIALVSVSRFKEVGMCVAAFVFLLTHRGTYGSWYKSLEPAPMSSYSFQRGKPGNTHSSWRKEDTLESSLFNLQFQIVFINWTKYKWCVCVCRFCLTICKGI